jgi:aminoglycoside phosphotransferase (APT) family kinase protein
MTEPAALPSEPSAPADGPAGLDLQRLRDHLARHRPDLLDGPVHASLIAGGRSNLTYVVTSGRQDFVLRRPPLGHVLATAHDMSREFRVISALAATRVPVPAALLLCPHDDVLGAPFYLMERISGEIYRSRVQTDPLTSQQRHRLTDAMMDTLADLHAVDPTAVGLADFGRPDGFLARQVRRWSGQLDRSRSRPLEGIDELHARLAATVPTSTHVGRIVHGDYRLDNLIVDPMTLSVRAVLDWEMATLGDPLTDLGLLLTYWEVLGGDAAAGNPVADGLGPAAGFPSGDQLIGRYAARSGIDVGPLDWHVALGCFKLAVICEGIHYRYRLGQTVGYGFDRVGELVDPLVARGLAAVKQP